MVYLCALGLPFVLAAAPARAAVDGRACPVGLSGDATEPVPASLAPAVIAAFSVRMTPADVMREGVVRCANGVVLACLTGANLNCGKADTSKSSEGGASWCKDHPNASFIPMFATGHATVYSWHCAGATAVAGRQVQPVDAAGFIANNWRILK